MCRLCGDIDEMNNHMIYKCNELTQNEYKTKHDCLRKVIQWELYKKLKFAILPKDKFISQNMSSGKRCIKFNVKLRIQNR